MIYTTLYIQLQEWGVLCTAELCLGSCVEGTRLESRLPVEGPTCEYGISELAQLSVSLGLYFSLNIKNWEGT